MWSVKRRVVAGIAALMVLFLAVVLVQLVVGDRLQSRQQAHADRIAKALTANQAVLQHMTDAETGVRGFQLTGGKQFLEPYDSGRVGAFTAFDQVAAATGDPEVQRLLYAERQAAAHWLYAYAIPIVNAGVADADQDRANRGKKMFDALRTANARVDQAIHEERQDVAAADRRDARLAQGLFASLAVAFLVLALLLAAVHHWLLLAPMEHLRMTLRRLAEGDHSARAVPAGPCEMRAVIGTLNDLAAETERLLDAEQARSVRNELRQAVAAELRSGLELATAADRISALVGGTLGAAALYARIPVDAGTVVDARWPADAPVLPADAADGIAADRWGAVLVLPGGAAGVPLAADIDCPPGLLYLTRPDRPEWTAAERRLLSAIGREIEYAVSQQRLQSRQARLISELRALDARKDAFVATVTHELRTPLTSILGYTEMLDDGDGGRLSPMQHRGVQAILRNAMRLQETVGDLLLLHKGGDRDEAGAEPLDLAALARDVIAELTPSARARDLCLSVDPEPVRVSGDAGQLQRMMRNLVENAIKFTRPGGRVAFRLTARDGEAVLTVTDTGIGIPAGDQPGLFTPFHRGTNAMDQAVQGSGLGLAIVANIVAEHGGTVNVRSRVGEGSTFTVTLPAAAPTADSPAAVTPDAGLPDAVATAEQVS